MRCRIQLSVVAFILVSLLLLFLNQWTGELWEEKAIAASNLFLPPARPNEITNAAISQPPARPNEITNAAISQPPARPNEITNATICQPPARPNEITNATISQPPASPNQITNATISQPPASPNEITNAAISQLPASPNEITNVTISQPPACPCYLVTISQPPASPNEITNATIRQPPASPNQITNVTISQPPASPKEVMNATVNQTKTETKKAIRCSSATMCSPQSKLQSPVPGTEAASCPSYFNWIHNDLKPWQSSGITVDIVQAARASATFRLIIRRGRLYIEFYRPSFQTRGLYTIWGFAQLLKFYPGRVPDVDLMFNTNDTPLIRRVQPENQTSTSTATAPPPPLFRYCSSEDTYDIAFPDWSFWGWPEVKIPPWEMLVQEILNGSREVKWEERDPTAFWKGNPLSRSRRELLNCSNRPHWNGRLYIQDWRKEYSEGFRDSKIANQCKNRYKIYIEGRAWSASLKYILACDSPALVVKPKFHDFFSRGLVPKRHYLPVRDDKICESIEFAVNWGNIHTKEAMKIGKAGRDFIVNELKMSNVYDYMLHFLKEYAKLLKYKPSVTRHAVEYCSESIACLIKGRENVYLKDSMVKNASRLVPCKMN